ncbi:MAG TPA: HAMP domain-containing sensor histidine kinase, partial [Acidimicrobiales bacterium]
FVAFLGTDGSVVSQIDPGLRDESPPQLDPSMVTSRATEQDETPRVFTAEAGGGNDARFRVAVVRLANGPGYAVVGVSLKETDATYERLLAVLALSTGAVIVVLALVAFWVIRLGIRPIDRMAETADAIAAGDVSRRVEPGRPGTEVGRLGVALNAMLHQIEWAFAERGASEYRLRRFVADASHELRTPLTSIQGYVELYRSGAVQSGPELDDAMRRVAAESTRMGVLVDDLLLLARLDQGRPLDRHLLDITALVRDSVLDARAVEPDRHIELDLPDGPLLVAADALSLHQAVGNLLANVRAHTPPGSPVEIRVTTADGVAEVAVVDHGSGISDEERSRVFERFHRGDPSRARSGVGGSGLGLSIVAAVADAHGGSARAEATPGGGATFVIDLPLPTAATPRPPAAAPGPVAGDGPNSQEVHISFP